MKVVKVVDIRYQNKGAIYCTLYPPHNKPVAGYGEGAIEKGAIGALVQGLFGREQGLFAAGS